MKAIVANAFKRKYVRKEDTTFTGEVGESWGYAQLSDDAQSKVATSAVLHKPVPTPKK